MAKTCVVCSDGFTYPKGQGTCPKCGNFLKEVREETFNSNELEEDYSDVILSNFDWEEKSKPVSVSHQPVNNSYTEVTQESIPTPKVKSPVKKKVKPKKATSFVKITGQVQNFHEEIEPKKPLERWMASLVSGIPLANDGYESNFQVYDEENQGHEAIIYGKIVRGRINDNDIVRIVGKRDRHNSIVAHSIENLNSNTLVSFQSGLSAQAVRIITLVGVLLIIAFLIFLANFDWEGFLNMLVVGAMNLIFKIISIFLPIIIIVGAFWFMAKKPFR